MIPPYTQRQQADYEFEKVKRAIKDSFLNYHLEERPFSARIILKKSFLKDFSSNLLPVLPTSTPVKNTFSPFKFDSGIAHDLSDELDKTVSKLNQEINDLKKELAKKYPPSTRGHRCLWELNNEDKIQ